MNVSNFFGKPISGWGLDGEVHFVRDNMTRDSENLMLLMEAIGRDYCNRVAARDYLPANITSSRSRTLLRISALVSIANALNTGTARAARKAVRGLRGTPEQNAVLEMSRSVISNNATDFIHKCTRPNLAWMDDDEYFHRSALVPSTKLFSRKHQYTALKAKKAIQAVAWAAIQSIVDAMDPHSDSSSDEDVNILLSPREGRITSKTPRLLPRQRRDWWIRLFKHALSRYSQESASLTIAALESFILHLQSGGQEGGACLFLREEFDESSFELGPNVRSL